MKNHEIDYKIYGEELQCVEVHLDPTETVVAESWNFMMMESWITMNTIFGDGSHPDWSVMWKILSAWKRYLIWESIFMTSYTNTCESRKSVTFASPYPWKIIAVNLNDHWWKIICQKDAFLCAAKWVCVGLEFQKKLRVWFFGGEWFIMEKLEWDWYAFMQWWWYIVEKSLSEWETIKIDTWCLIWFTKDVGYDIEFVWWVKNTLFGGEWMFFVTLCGPWTVWVQSLPINRLAWRILSYAASSKEEWSMIWWISDLFWGDNK